jgi:hypothetical protein
VTVISTFDGGLMLVGTPGAIVRAYIARDVWRSDTVEADRGAYAFASASQYAAAFFESR